MSAIKDPHLKATQKIWNAFAGKDVSDPIINLIQSQVVNSQKIWDLRISAKRRNVPKMERLQTSPKAISRLANNGQRRVVLDAVQMYCVVNKWQIHLRLMRTVWA